MKKKIGIGQDPENLAEFLPLEVDSLLELSSILTRFNWSTGLFSGNSRKKTSFQEAHFIALDVDDGLELDQARGIFSPFQHILAPTRSHQIEKNGMVRDRFRVVLVLERPITTVEEWDGTWHELFRLYPFIDRACKDPSRLYFPSKSIDQVVSTGKTIPVSKMEPRQSSGVLGPLAELSDSKLARATLEFLVQGAKVGEWNRTLFKAAKDWQEQGLSKDDFVERATLITGSLDSKDIQTIQSAFNSDPLYPPRVLLEIADQSPDEPTASYSAGDLSDLTISYLSNKDLVKGEPTEIEGLDKLLGGGKRLGEVTVWHAEAKTGKNTLWHFMQCLWFKKELKQAYASRELHVPSEVLPDYLSILTQTNARLEEMSDALAAIYKEELRKCQIWFAQGLGHFPLDELRQWVRSMKEQGILYFWFDHLHYMLEDPEDHKAASKLMKMIKELAVMEQIHIDIIVQPNKLLEGQRLSLNSIKGGSAMGQTLDNLIILERVKDAQTENTMRLTLDVGRSKLCKLGSLYMVYDPNTMTFQEADKEASKVAKIEPDYEFEESPIIRKLRAIE